MTDFETIIKECVDDVWSYLDYDSSSSLNRCQVKKVVCTMNANNQKISNQFDNAYTKFGKLESDTMAKQELIDFVKFIHGFPIMVNNKMRQFVC